MSRPSRKSTKGGVVHPSVARTLTKLGEDIGTARRLRRIASQDMADRMGVDRGTLRRLESGDPGVSLNTLAMALIALGLEDRLVDLVDHAKDDIGLMQNKANLPQRISRGPRKRADNRSDGVAAPGSDEPEGW